MSNDFDDLFRRNDSSNASHAVGDGYLSSENPFADLQSSGVLQYGSGGVNAASRGIQDGDAAGPSLSSSASGFAFASPQASPPSARSGDGWGQTQGQGQDSNRSDIRRGSTSSSGSNGDVDGDGAHNDSNGHNGVDRVLVSPYVSNPGSSTDEGELDDVDVDHMARSTATATATAIPIDAAQSSQQLSQQTNADPGSSFYNDDHALDPSFNPYADPHGPSTEQDAFARAAITDDEVARGFADDDGDALPSTSYSSVQERDEDKEGETGHQDETSTRAEQDAIAEDAASIRTVGLDSIHNDAASVRSQQQQSLREQVCVSYFGWWRAERRADVGFD